MTNEKHSPAPWAFCIVLDADGRTVATYQASDRGRTYDEEEAQAQANGCLIVAAPLMLAALEACERWIYQRVPSDDWPACLEDAQAAIALARGGAVVGATSPAPTTRRAPWADGKA